MDKMLSDLIEARLGLQEKEALVDRQKGVMKKQKTQLEQLQHNVSNLSAELKESRTRQTMVPPNPEQEQTVGMMRTEIREKELQLKEKDQILREREMDWKVELHELKGKLTQQQMQHEKAVNELHELQATAISQDNGQLAAATSQTEAEKARAEQYFHELQHLKTTHAQTLSQIESEKAKTQQVVQELQQLKTMHAEALSQVEAEKAKTQQYAQELQQLKATSAETATVKDNSQLLDQLKAAHATELAEIPRISDFFKNNSERLSRQMKDMMAENHTLKESIKTKDREAQEQASHINAIELQMRGF
jgi:chromosome segregation ATPase